MRVLVGRFAVLFDIFLSHCSGNTLEDALRGRMRDPLSWGSNHADNKKPVQRLVKDMQVRVAQKVRLAEWRRRFEAKRAAQG